LDDQSAAPGAVLRLDDRLIAAADGIH